MKTILYVLQLVIGIPLMVIALIGLLLFHRNFDRWVTRFNL